MSEKIMQYFDPRTLQSPRQQAEVGEPYSELAGKLQSSLPDGPEKTVALRKLLESRDCAVRAVTRPGEPLR